LLIQKEVALRLCAQPPKMNLLAATIQIWATPRILFSVPRGSFAPPPDVDSAVVVLKTIPLPFPASRLPDYFSFVRALFRQPRKTIRNNLVAGGFCKKTEPCGPAQRMAGMSEKNRPHSLKIRDVSGLFFLFYPK